MGKIDFLNLFLHHVDLVFFFTCMEFPEIILILIFPFF